MLLYIDDPIYSIDSECSLILLILTSGTECNNEFTNFDKIFSINLMLHLHCYMYVCCTNWSLIAQ